MAFQGSLAELHLPDIIQLVSVSGKSGVFRLIDGSHRGDIWLQEGRIVHAEHEDLSGEEAVYALAIWRTGEFRFEAGVDSPRQTIQKSNTNLLMEAARRLDEWRVLSKKIPSVELVPEFVILENREGQINLNTMEWLLLSKIDGQRSVKQIAAAAGMGVFDAAKLLYGLVATNLIRLRQGGATPAAGRTQPAAAQAGTTATAGAAQPAGPAQAGTRPATRAAQPTPLQQLRPVRSRRRHRCSHGSRGCATSAWRCSARSARASCRSTTCARAPTSSAAPAPRRSTTRSSRSPAPPRSSRAARSPTPS